MSSSGGAITIEVGTNETGTEPPSSLQFNITAVHALTREEKEFAMDTRQYRDGEVIEFLLTGFVKEEEVEPVYLITATCTNEFGTSQDSDSLSVAVQFSTGM